MTAPPSPSPISGHARETVSLVVPDHVLRAAVEQVCDMRDLCDEDVGRDQYDREQYEKFIRIASRRRTSDRVSIPVDTLRAVLEAIDGPMEIAFDCEQYDVCHMRFSAIGHAALAERMHRSLGLIAHHDRRKAASTGQPHRAGGNNPAFGTRWHNGRRVPDEHEQAAIRRAIELHSAGESHRRIVEILAAEGFTNRRRHKINRTTVAAILARAVNDCAPGAKGAV